MSKVHAVLLIPHAGDRERYESKIERPTDLFGCWRWTGGRTDRGYGRFKLKGKVVRAHRVAFAIEHGRDPAGLVLHSCDHPWCVNPAHLREGTPSDNMQDRSVRGGLDQRGTRNPAAHLTPEDVRAIRRDSRAQREIAEDYGIGQSHVSQIKRGVIWAHV
jgi:hypothetical protein